MHHSVPTHLVQVVRERVVHPIVELARKERALEHDRRQVRGGAKQRRGDPPVRACVCAVCVCAVCVYAVCVCVCVCAVCVCAMCVCAMCVCAMCVCVCARGGSASAPPACTHAIARRGGQAPSARRDVHTHMNIAAVVICAPRKSSCEPERMKSVTMMDSMMSWVCVCAHARVRVRVHVCVRVRARVCG